VWVRHRGHSKDAKGELDGRIVGSLEGLFRVWDHVNREHEVSLVSLLLVRVSSQAGGEEAMVPIERGKAGRRLNVVQIAAVEGMAHLIGVKQDSIWLINNRIDLNTWNEVYDWGIVFAICEGGKWGSELYSNGI